MRLCPRLASALLATLTSAAICRADLADLGVVELQLTSDRDYDNPFWDATVTVTATAPSGAVQTCEAFWDGERIWRARWRGDETGSWTWTAQASDADNAGLNRSGAIEHGAARPPARLQVSADGSHLETEAGEPHFWLGDTAWNGALKSTIEDWKAYLARRDEQKFTAIQFVTTQWRGGDTTIPRHLFAGTERITVDPAAFAELDDKVAAVTRHGMRPAPVMLWSLNPTDPGQALAEADAIRLARYEVARWGALSPVWLLGGDGRYLNEFTERWKRVGRAVFNDRPEQLVTLHPSGLTWIGDAFAGEEWLDFIGYQSGHGDGASDLKWLVDGPPAHADKRGKPAINLEPNYEGHPAYQSGQPFDAASVRRAAYWSLLVHAPAGVTYGNNEIWCWNTETADAENHGNLRHIRPWRDGLVTEGIDGMTLLRTFFESGPWPQLRPAQQLLRAQPGGDDPQRFIAVAQTAGGDWTVAYLPAGGRVALQLDAAGQTAEWVNPRDGARQPAMLVDGEPGAYAAPDDQDWVLSIRQLE